MFPDKYLCFCEREYPRSWSILKTKKIIYCDRIKWNFKAISNGICDKCCDAYTCETTRTYEAHDSLELWVGYLLTSEKSIDRLYESIEFSMFSSP